jgi:hypothetical protein
MVLVRSHSSSADDASTRALYDAVPYSVSNDANTVSYSVCNDANTVSSAVPDTATTVVDFDISFVFGGIVESGRQSNVSVAGSNWQQLNRCS